MPKHREAAPEQMSLFADDAASKGGGSARRVGNSAAGSALSRETLLETLGLAAFAGKLAAEGSYADLLEKHGDRDSIPDACGGGIIYVKADGRGAVGKILNGLIEDPPAWLMVTREPGRGYGVHLHYGFVCQERTPMIAAAHAALEVIREELDVEGYVEEYVD